jgi:DNA-binding transcriptional MerR regulator
MFTIGEFSKLTQLTVKTLRFYHEEGLLIPGFVDPDTGYRYYDHRHVETARAITYLRSLEFSLSDIKELLSHEADEDLMNVLERQQSTIKERIKHLRKAALSIDQFIREEKEATAMAHTVNQVQERTLEPLLVGGIRMKGQYSDCGQAFAKIGRSLGRFICGKPLLLHYDTEFRDEDADFEACMPIRQRKEVDGIAIHELPGGRCVSLVHQGPYDQLSRSYARIFEYINDLKCRVIVPTREVYLKGPGMFFKGNPKNYLTDIQILIETDGIVK